MSSQKLSDADKQAILEQYRQHNETTSTLAKRYGVSNSTISRLLKTHLSREEYHTLIRRKRRGGEAEAAEASDSADSDDADPYAALSELVGEDFAAWDDSEDDFDEESGSEAEASSASEEVEEGDVRIRELSEANFPQTCYLVIDRRSGDPIALPLREFSELGKLPPLERDHPTLPVFDSHKVARRFSKKTQRTIQVPDSQLFFKVRSQLAAKGIARLLLNGQVYALSSG
ncbi:MAG: transposase [Cyanobacteria bacterium QS_8_64_29]|nr:MAG: transposase [Cyanobacteria bacterium QS_8_64_29]